MVGMGGVCHRPGSLRRGMTWDGEKGGWCGAQAARKPDAGVERGRKLPPWVAVGGQSTWGQGEAWQPRCNLTRFLSTGTPASSFPSLVCALPLSVNSALIASAACCYIAVAGNLKDFMTAAQLSGNVPRTVNSSSDRERPVFDPAADPKKSKDSQKIREKVRRRAVLVFHVFW